MSLFWNHWCFVYCDTWAIFPFAGEFWPQLGSVLIETVLSLRFKSNLLFHSKKQKSWENQLLKMLMYLHTTGWRFGICRSELLWDQCGIRSGKTYMSGIYNIQSHVQIQHLDLMRLTLRVFSLCLERFRVMTETNRQITTDLSNPAWWIDTMQIVYTQFFQTWTQL